MAIKKRRLKKNKIISSRPLFDLRLIVLAILSLLLLSTFILSNYLKNRNNSVAPVKSSAMDCSGGGTNDDAQCDQQVNPCHFSCNVQLNGNPVFIPSCCDEIERTGDPLKCCFGARRMCTPKQCSTIPAGVKKERCGQLWDLGCCPVVMDGCELHPPGVTSAPRVSYDDLPSAATPTILPTNTPIPTMIIQSTIVIPTQVIQPTQFIPAAPTAFSTQAPIYVVATGVPTAIPAITSIPTPVPTVPSAASVISKQVVDFIQSAKEAISKFFSAVLP